MGVPTYALVLMSHEGSHALAAKLLGAEITDMSLMPGPHPRTGKFFFGYVSVRGLKTKEHKAFFYAAPKITDALMLGGYAALNLSGNMPSNPYGKLGVLVLATGYWVDFTKDVIAFWDHNDTVKLYKLMGLKNEWERLSGRIVHLSLSALAGYVLVKGYQELLEEEQSGMSNALILPLMSKPF